MDLSWEKQQLYQPTYKPWLDPNTEFAEWMQLITPYTLVPADRCWVLFSLGIQALSSYPLGQFWECGVYKGGTALLLAKIVEKWRSDASVGLNLFDSFEGLPKTGELDLGHSKGDFADTSMESVRALFGDRLRIPIRISKGLIPSTFVQFQDQKIAFAHIDIDLYASVMACCEFIYPRLVRGSFMVFDDYGFVQCYGARIAVDRFFEDKPEVPLVLHTGQAVIFKV